MLQLILRMLGSSTRGNRSAAIKLRSNEQASLLRLFCGCLGHRPVEIGRCNRNMTIINDCCFFFLFFPFFFNAALLFPLDDCFFYTLYKHNYNHRVMKQRLQLIQRMLGSSTRGNRSAAINSRSNKSASLLHLFSGCLGHRPVEIGRCNRNTTIIND